MGEWELTEKEVKEGPQGQCNSLKAARESRKSASRLFYGGGWTVSSFSLSADRLEARVRLSCRRAGRQTVSLDPCSLRSIRSLAAGELQTSLLLCPWHNATDLLLPSCYPERLLPFHHASVRYPRVELPCATSILTIQQSPAGQKGMSLTNAVR
jgi:hypothetical protein